MAKKTQELLARALEVIHSVDYRVSLRWVFYRLLQEGYYSKKSDYNRWVALSSRARKEFFDGWHPAILADETRGRVQRTGGEETVQDCVDSLISELNNFEASFFVDHFYHQDHYVEIWFEARAMAQQFEHYTDDIDLVPFAGHPSIPFKWNIAKHLEYVANRYGKDIIILYFGDYDYHGEVIIDSAQDDIWNWCETDFEVIRCGLTPEQARKYQVPENPAKPGEYQWEALSDEGAKEIIQACVSKYIDKDIITKLTDEALEEEAFWGEKIQRAFKEMDLDDED
jgi:hypothetical protein